MRERLDTEQPDIKASSAKERLDFVKSKRAGKAAANPTRQRLVFEDKVSDPAVVPEFHAPAIGRLPAISDPVVYATIVEAVRAGNFLSTAAFLAGISYETMMNSLERGQKGENDLYYNFWLDVKRAEAESEQALVKHIADAAAFDFKAAVELLQRRFPDRWAKRDSTTIKHEVTGKVDHSHRNEFADKILDNPLLRQQTRDLLRQMNSKDIVDGEFTEVDD